MSGKKTLALLLAAVISASGIVSVAADTEDVVTYEQLEECTVEMEKFLVVTKLAFKQHVRLYQRIFHDV